LKRQGTRRRGRHVSRRTKSLGAEIMDGTKKKECILVIVKKEISRVSFSLPPSLSLSLSLSLSVFFLIHIWKTYAST